MNVDLLDVIAATAESLGIQLTLLSPPFETISTIDYNFRKRLYQDYDYSDIILRIQRLDKPGIILHVNDDFKLNYTFFLFDPDQAEEYHAERCCIGPYLINGFSSNQFRLLMDQKNIPASLYDETLEFYNRIPVLPSFDGWMAQWAVFSTLLFGDKAEIRFADTENLGSLHPDYTDYQISSTPDIAMNAIEERYKAEAEFMHAVSVGNTEQAMLLHQKFLQFRLNPRTPDPIRNQKNLLITLNTLLRKAAQAGYVHPIHIDNLSTQLAVQLESASSENQLNKLRNNMVRKYCMLVKNYSRRAYSSLVQTCMDHIDFHYSEELSLDSLAKMCSVSNSYLSALFKKEVQMTLTDYINSTRIRQSLILLNSTSLSIQDIAFQCGFTDSNYFTRTFKKFQGKSPKVYREEIRK